MSITFRVNLETKGSLNHALPNAQTDAVTNFKETRHLYAPNLILNNHYLAAVGADNKYLKHGDEFTVEGVRSIYLRDNFSDQAVTQRSRDQAFLTVV